MFYFYPETKRGPVQIPSCSKQLDGVANFLSLLPDFPAPDVRSVPHGTILDRQQTLFLIVRALTDGQLRSFLIKAMHYELPPETTVNTDLLDVEQMIRLLDYAILYAGSNDVPGEVQLDRFVHLYEHGAFNYLLFYPNAHRISKTNQRSLRTLRFLDVKGVVRTHTINHHTARLNVPALLRSVPELISMLAARWKLLDKSLFGFAILQLLSGLNLHHISDNLPHSALNIIRYHDHRKGTLLTLSDGYQVLILHSNNLDAPTDFDCSIVITEPALIAKIVELWAQPQPKNTRLTGTGWSIYQDGSADLDSRYPERSSVTMQRLRQLLTDPTTTQLTFCSQFLPDLEELQLLDRRLAFDELFSCTVFSPHPRMFSALYRATGGTHCAAFAQQLVERYGNRFALRYANEAYIHSKFVIINGSRLLIGSHNFNRELVRSRTSELTLEIDEMSDVTNSSMESLLVKLRTQTHPYLPGCSTQS